MDFLVNKVNVVNLFRIAYRMKMDSFVKNPGYLHLVLTIFEALDKKSLLKCRIVCKSFQVIIDNQTSLWWRLLADSIEEQQLNAVDDEESMEEQNVLVGIARDHLNIEVDCISW